MEKNLVKTWVYRNKKGEPFGEVRRFEEITLDGQSRKSIIPYFNADGKAGIPEGIPAHHLIFGLDSVKDMNAPIYIVEGEKCAHALHGLGFQAVTSLGGCGRIQHIDWACLEGAKRIILLPDNDDLGDKFMHVVYFRLKKLASKPEIKVCNLPELPHKGDVCDYLKSYEQLQEWNELDDLHHYAEHQAIVQKLLEDISAQIDDIPAHWKFIVVGKGQNRHKLIALNDFKRIKLKQRRKLLSPWLSEGSINMVFADRGIGKTFFCLSSAVALANGEEFLGYKADKPVSVLYLDGEMQASAMQERLQLLTQGKDTLANLHIFTPDCQDLTDHIPDLGKLCGRAEVNHMVERVNPHVIFIDNISTFIRTGSENEGDSWSPVQEWAVQMRKQGRAVIFVHHANKEGKQRGSHKKEDVMDVVIQLKRPDDYIQGTDATRMLIRYTKARHLGADDTQDIEATLETSEGNLSWSYKAGDITFERVASLLKDGDMSMSEIADEFGVSKSTIHRWKQKAKEQNKL